MQRILIVEDDFDLAEGLTYNFRREGYAVTVAETGEQGLRLALNEKTKPSLVLLDLMLPGMNGMEFCRRLRRDSLTEKTPVIMLTGKTTEADRIAGLEAGADDYVIKPFSIKELMARVRAVIRRNDQRSFEVFEDDCIRLDLGEMRVFCNNKNVNLTRKEFALLVQLVKNIGRVAPRQMLLDNIWGYSYFGDTRTLDVHIRRLRKKLGACGDCIETVVGTGYRFQEHRAAH